MLIAKKPALFLKSLSAVSLFVLLQNYGHTQETGYLKNIKKSVSGFIKPKDDQSFRIAQLQQLSDFNFQPDDQFNEPLPVVQSHIGQKANLNNLYLENTQKNTPYFASTKILSIEEAVQIAVKRNPNISQSISTLASQNNVVPLIRPLNLVL